MTKRNPFPGMNPFFEQRWRDAHTMIIAGLRNELNDELPEDLVAGAEEEVVTIGAGEEARRLRPDVQVREPWAQSASGSAVAVTPRTNLVETQPIYVFTDDEVERWVEIRDETGRLITAIELLSPTNKREFWQRERYGSRRHSFISAGVNEVEIDLVRQGRWVFPGAVCETLRRTGAIYGVNVFRATSSKQNTLYPIQLRQRLPVIKIPLRPTDSDVLLDLQPLIDECHERGRYHLLDYSAPLDPPFATDDNAWAGKLLHDSGLR